MLKPSAHCLIRIRPILGLAGFVFLLMVKYSLDFNPNLLFILQILILITTHYLIGILR